MKRNLGQTDRIIRIILAIVVLLLARFAVSGPSSVVAIILYVAAAILIVAGVAGFCPLYVPFGINTNKEKK